MLDDQIARIVTYLKNEGIYEETVIVFTTDHGDMMGDHAQISKGTVHYDTGIRIPFIVSGGGVRPGVSSRLTCTLDLFPTFCDFADAPPGVRPPLEGKSVAPDCRGVPATDTWDAVSVCVGRAASVVTADGRRYTRYLESDFCQMFDLTEDPEELTNRYGDPGLLPVQSRLAEALADVSLRPNRIPQYRNLPVFEGRKWALGGNGSFQFVDPAAQYRNPPCPYL
jgi:arylsulfatase A-like enzyme